MNGHSGPLIQGAAVIILLVVPFRIRLRRRGILPSRRRRSVCLPKRNPTCQPAPTGPGCACEFEKLARFPTDIETKPITTRPSSGRAIAPRIWAFDASHEKGRGARMPRPFRSGTSGELPPISLQVNAQAPTATEPMRQVGRGFQSATQLPGNLDP